MVAAVVVLLKFCNEEKDSLGKKSPHWSFSCGKPKTREFGNAMDFAWRHLESFAVCGISVLLESSGFTVSSPSIAFQLFIGVRAQNSSIVE